MKNLVIALTVFAFAIIIMASCSTNELTEAQKGKIKLKVFERLSEFNDDPSEGRFSAGCDFDAIYNGGWWFDHHDKKFVVFINNSTPKAKYCQELVVEYYREMLKKVNGKRFTDRFWDVSSLDNPIGFLEREKQLEIFNGEKQFFTKNSNFIKYYDEFLGDGEKWSYRAQVLEFEAPLCPDNVLIYFLQREIRFGSVETITPLLNETLKRFGSLNYEVALNAFNDLNYGKKFHIEQIEQKNTKKMVSRTISPEKFRNILRKESKINYRSQMSMDFYLK